MTWTRFSARTRVSNYGAQSAWCRADYGRLLRPTARVGASRSSSGGVFPDPSQSQSLLACTATPGTGSYQKRRRYRRMRHQAPHTWPANMSHLTGGRQVFDRAQFQRCPSGDKPCHQCSPATIRTCSATAIRPERPPTVSGSEEAAPELRKQAGQVSFSAVSSTRGRRSGGWRGRPC
jgi:hypothetical protein